MKNGKGAGSRQIHLVCKTCTTWVVKGCLQKGGDFKITKVEGSHVDCAGGGRTSSAVVQPLVNQLVRANPKIAGTAIKRTLKTVGFTVSDRQSQRAKKRIATATKGDGAAALSRLPSLFQGIERDCPGSIATVEMSPDNRFVRSFLMLGKAAYVAAHSVPKIVAMDAGHLKGSWHGVMYVLCMHDSNNKIIHVSTVLADKENATNYEFLLQQTCRNEHMQRLLSSGEVTFYIDGHKGSPAALRAVLPQAPWRACVRHFITNRNMKAMGQAYSNAVYRAAVAPTKALFEEIMEPVKKDFPGNYGMLMSNDLKKWTHHATPSNLVNLKMSTSNSAESSISAVGHQTREMDPYHLHIGIAEKTAEQLATNAELKKDSSAILVPFAAKFMEDERLLSLHKHVKSLGLGTYLVQEHGKSQYGNRVTIVLPDTEGKGGRVECTCSVPSRFHLLCQDSLAVLKSIDRLDCTRAHVDGGYTLASYRALHSHPDYPVVLPIWSELSKGDLLPPRQVTRQAGAPKKKRGPRQRSRIPGRNDNCQRGRGNVAQGGGGRGGGGNAQPVPVHGMGSVRSHVGDLNVGGSAGERPTGRVWGGLAVQRYGSQDASGRDHTAGAGAGSSAMLSQSQGSIDLS
ncbi:conserved unknown protein [Ectocarpus siliculosus]|uniref:MULE transposase domain-containing protein n=1 Tax=Ectocarpus siliculosus TaxID=2880 RepID=D7G6Q0_ECTSI|nr:conserved unknown protein [Ectocarpus siliculosus]|eukprot:CBJ27635.1 conserved unknown protein [Ectocarpus siliculosus]